MDDNLHPIDADSRKPGRFLVTSDGVDKPPELGEAQDVMEQGEGHCQDENREGDSQEGSAADEQEDRIIVEDGLAVHHDQSQSPVENHAPEGDDEGRNGEFFDEIAMERADEDADGQDEDDAKPERHPEVHQEHGNQNPRESDEGSHRKVDARYDDDPGHPESDDGVEGRLVQDVQQVPRAHEKELTAVVIDLEDVHQQKEQDRQADDDEVGSGNVELFQCFLHSVSLPSPGS